MSRNSIGQIGLGAIGTIYAEHLLRAENTLMIYDADDSHVKPLEQQGAVKSENPSTLAAASDIVLLALPSPDAARDTMLGENGVLAGARERLLVVDVSTIDPNTARALYAAAKERGVDYIEAPVSGGEPGGAGTDGARAANISFMVGGDRDAFERAKPLMSILGKRFFHLGPAGQGSTVKLISNLIAGLHNLVATEAFVLGAAAGIDPETLFEVFDGTDAKSFWLTEYFAPRIRRKDFEPGFSVDLQYKDHRLAEDLGRRLAIPLPFNAMAIQAYQLLRAQGLGEKDLVESVNAFGELANVSVFSPRPTTEAL